jgi:hypothetical protein
VSTIKREPVTLVCDETGTDQVMAPLFSLFLSIVDAEDEDEAVYEETSAYQSLETESSNTYQSSGETASSTNGYQNPPPNPAGESAGSGGGSSGVSQHLFVHRWIATFQCEVLLP